MYIQVVYNSLKPFGATCFQMINKIHIIVCYVYALYAYMNKYTYIHTYSYMYIWMSISMFVWPLRQYLVIWCLSIFEETNKKRLSINIRLLRIKDCFRRIFRSALQSLITKCYPSIHMQIYMYVYIYNGDSLNQQISLNLIYEGILSVNFH